MKMKTKTMMMANSTIYPVWSTATTTRRRPTRSPRASRPRESLRERRRRRRRRRRRWLRQRRRRRRRRRPPHIKKNPRLSQTCKTVLASFSPRPGSASGAQLVTPRCFYCAVRVTGRKTFGLSCVMLKSANYLTTSLLASQNVARISTSSRSAISRMSILIFGVTCLRDMVFRVARRFVSVR